MKRCKRKLWCGKNVSEAHLDARACELSKGSGGALFIWARFYQTPTNYIVQELHGMCCSEHSRRSRSGNKFFGKKNLGQNIDIDSK